MTHEFKIRKRCKKEKKIRGGIADEENEEQGRRKEKESENKVVKKKELAGKDKGRKTTREVTIRKKARTDKSYHCRYT